MCKPRAPEIRLHDCMDGLSTAAVAGEGPERAREFEDFHELVRVFWPRVYRFALASLRDADAAQTVAQDCFYKAHRSAGSFRGEAGIQTWLMQIVVNLVRDHVRNRRLQFWRRNEALDGAALWAPDRRISPESEAAAHEKVRAVWRAAGTLPERQRTVFLLRFMEDMDLLEIARAAGMAEGTVKAHLFRALASIRRQMEEAR